ncbi:MAG: hypothetical protein O7G30_01715 [Proteobacteria bacterium]|nr:hypothetical protein [Pseudomonadota bacterium]
MSVKAGSGSAASWDRRAERGAMLGLRFGVAFFRLVGARLCLLLAIPVVTYFFLTDRDGRRASLDYLRRVHATPDGRRVLGRPPTRWTSYRHYRGFALAIVDRLDLWLGRESRFSFEFHGREPLAKLVKEKRGVLVLGAHLGSFDALRALARLDRVVVNLAMYTNHAARINRVFRDLSPEAEVRVIPLDPTSAHSVFALRGCIERGEMVAILADRVHPGDRRRRCEVPFLGAPASFPTGPHELAAVLGCPVFLLLGLRTGRRRYDVVAERLFERVELPRRPPERAARVASYVADYAAALERHVLRAPLQWYNFFDFWEQPRSGRMS